MIIDKEYLEMTEDEKKQKAIDKINEVFKHEKIFIMIGFVEKPKINTFNLTADTFFMLKNMSLSDFIQIVGSNCANAYFKEGNKLN